MVMAYASTSNITRLTCSLSVEIKEEQDKRTGNEGDSAE